jgi:hypothetical protein
MYFRLSIQGTLASGEVWSINPCFNLGGSFTPIWDQPSGDDIAQALLDVVIPTPLKDAYSAAGAITGYRLEGRGDDHTLLGVAESAFTSPVVGTAAATKPPQTAMVFSLRTNTPGASGRGRLYLPALSVQISATNFRVSSTAVEAFLTAMSEYLRDVQDTIKANAGVFPWSTVELCVVSKTTGNRPLVTRIQAGDILDTQRRRRDKLTENYQAQPFPGA